MNPYLIIYGYILAALFVNERMKIENKVLRLFFNVRTVFFIMFIFAGFRGNGNGDYFVYINNVKLVNSLDFVLNPGYFPFELGYRVIAYIINILHLHPQTIIFAMNGISIFSVYKFARKYSKNPIVSAVLFFPFLLSFDMHHSRAAVGMSLGLWFVAYLYEKKYVKSFLLLLLAFNFHKSSIVLIVILPFALFEPLKNIQSNLMKKPFLKIMLVIAFVTLFTVFDPLNIITQLLRNPLTMNFYKKFTSYIANERWSYPFRIYDPRFILILLNYLFFILIYKESNKFNNLLMTSLFLTVAAIVTLKTSTILTFRIYNYFHQFSIVLIPNVIFGTVDTTNIERLINRSTIRKLPFDVESKKIIELSSWLLLSLYCIYTLALISKQYEYYFFF